MRAESGLQSESRHGQKVVQLQSGVVFQALFLSGAKQN